MPNQPLTPAEAIAQSKGMPLTIAEAIADLIKEIPQLGKTKYQAAIDYEDAWVVDFFLGETKLKLERAETKESGQLEPLWGLSLTTLRSSLAAEDYPSLAAAIAALKSAAAEQMRVLELVNPGRAEAVARANQILKELVEMTPREKEIFKVEEPELVAKLMELLT